MKIEGKMKRFFVFCLIVVSSVFVISCSGGSKSDEGETITDNDNNSADTTEDSDVFDTLPEQPNNGDPTQNDAEPGPDDADTTQKPADDTDSEPDDDPDSGEPVLMNEGIYFGIIGFNEFQYSKEIGFLDKSTESIYKGFIDTLSYRDGTALYFADYTALEMMRDYQLPPNLKNVVLVTFTDGLDNISLANEEYNPENYGSTTEYRDALHDMIVNDKIHGTDVAAYTIGLKGVDVNDDTAFEETLNKLASSGENVFQVADMVEVKERFEEIAQSLYSVYKTVNLDVKVPGGYDDGLKLRFTFDNPESATDSNFYIEATYRRSEGRTLEEITYHGLAEGATTIPASFTEGAFYHFVFADLKYGDGSTIMADADVSSVMLWKKTSSGGWDRESEFDPESSKIERENKNSALIMLVLDCTTSLGSDFETMKEAAKDFVTTLVNGRSDTHVSNCTELPKNAEWNTVSKIIQKWNGSEWMPAATGIYNETSSTEECRFKCRSGYYWNGSVCRTRTIGEICPSHIPCVNEFSPQECEAEHKCIEHSFTAGEKIIIDNNTGLIWEKSPSSEKYSWENAFTRCKELKDSNFADISNWRVPNPLEVLSIADNIKFGPAIHPIFSEIAASGWMWTSKVYPQSSGYARAFDLKTGWLEYGIQTSTEAQVICVSGDEMLPSAVDDFVTSPDGLTVTDKKTGLMWQSGDSGSSSEKQDIRAYCRQLNTQNYAGYSDWRVPNRNELASILDHGKAMYPHSNFPGIPSGSDYWLLSSSLRPDKTEDSWSVHLYHGSIYYKGGGRIRCVR